MSDVSNLNYSYSAHTLEILRPVLFRNISSNLGNDADTKEGNGDPWQKIQSELTTSEIKHDVALCILAEALENNTGAMLDATLDACGPEACLEASALILSDLGTPTTSSVKSTNLVIALPLVLRTIRRQYLVKSSRGEDEGSTPFERTDMLESEIVSQILLRLPILISNACFVQELQLPSWSVRERFLTLLLQCCQAHRTVLIRRMVQMGSSDLVALALVDRMSMPWSAIPTIRDRLKLLQSIIRLTVQQKHSMTEHWKDVCESHILPTLAKHCQSPLLESSELARQLCRNLLLSNQHAGVPRFNRILAHTIAILLNECGVPNDVDEEDSIGDNDGRNDHSDRSMQNQLLYQTFNDLVLLWKERRFVQRTPLSTQRLITYFLQSSIPLLDCLSASSDASICLIRGVSVRLESSLVEVRVDGMRVAQLLAVVVGGTVHFDELDEEEDDCELPTEPSTSIGESMTQQDFPVFVSHRQRRKYRDLDADYHSSDSEQGDLDDDDDSLEWDDELVPLDQGDDDEEDLRETPKPNYLRECLEYLQTPETQPHAASRHQTALEFLPELIQSQPYDLSDVAVPLAQQLFRIEDKFGMENFDERIRTCTVALTVGECVGVGDYVIGYIFDEVSLYSRMLGFYTLQLAARDLSGTNDLESSRQSLSDLALDARVSGNRRLVPNIESLTRRWGRLNHSVRKPTAKNRFIYVAPRWFYSLIGNFMDRKGDVQLWGGANGARTLAHLLITLATILECCPVTTAAVMPRDLLQFCWTFRTSEDSTLRSAVLVAMASSLATCDDATLVHALLCGSAMDLPSFLSNVVRTDPDQLCRTLAQTISKNVFQVLQQPTDHLLR